MGTVGADASDEQAPLDLQPRSMWRMRTTWFVRSKLIPPRPVAGAIERGRHSLARTEFNLPRLTVLQAPAGFGKTTLAANWLEHSRAGRLCVWVSLDESDRTASSAFAYLVEGLRSVAPQLLDAEAPAADDLLTLTEQALANLAIAALDRTSQEVLVVLDDVQMLADSTARAALRGFAERLPPNSRLVVTSRTPIDGTFFRLRAQGSLLVLGPEQLRFDRDEITQVVGDRSSAEIDRLLQATGGWPLGVQLAHFEGTHLPAVDSSSALKGRLTERILSSFVPGARRALVFSSLFERVRGELLDAALERSDSSGLLEQLSLETPFLLPLHGDTGWTRLHSVFKDALRGQLGYFDVVEVQNVHRRAAEWFFGRGLLREAFLHGESSGDTEFFADLAERAGGWRLALGGGRNALAAFTVLPTLDGLRYPRLRLAHFYSLAQDGLIREARGYFELLRQNTRDFTRGRYDSWDAALAIECRVIDTVIRIYEDRSQLVEEALELERLMTATVNLDPRVACLSGNLLSYAYFDSGEYEQCISAGERALTRDRATGVTYGEIYLHIYLGLACFRLGRLADAQTHYDQALEQAQAQFGDNSNQAAIARVLMAELMAESGRLDASAELLTQALYLNLRRDGWFDNYFSALETLVRLEVLRKGTHAALQTLDDIEYRLQTRKLARLQSLIHLLRAEVSARAGQLEAFRKHWDAAQRAHSLSPETEHSARDGRLWESVVIVATAAAIAEAKFATAITLADNAMARLNHRVRPRTRLRLRLLRAVAQYRGGHPAIARRAAGEAIQQDRAAQHVLSIVWDLGPLLCELVPSFSKAVVGAASAGANPAPPLPAPSVLSPRETEVLREIGLGFSNKEIARRLLISESTVKTHRERIYEKLEVSTRSAALAVARSRSLLTD